MRESFIFYFLLYLGETDLIKKGEGVDVVLLSGTHVMEGSARMVVLGVGLNSQVGTIMSLLGATADEHTEKEKKKERQSKIKELNERTKSDATKQTVNTEDETKLQTSASISERQSTEDRPKSVKISTDAAEIIPIESNPGSKAEHGSNGKLESAQSDDDEVIRSNEGKHKCK